MTMKLKKSKGSYLKSLDATCVDRVTEDLQKCLDEWVADGQDVESSIIALMSFALDIGFHYSENPTQVVHAISALITEKMENENLDVNDMLNNFYADGYIKENTLH